MSFRPSPIAAEEMDQLIGIMIGTREKPSSQASKKSCFFTGLDMGRAVQKLTYPQDDVEFAFNATKCGGGKEKRTNRG